MAEMLPLVSIGVPVRNGADTLGYMLASIERQTYRNIEVIIADNASEDGTADVIRAWAQGRQHVRLIRHASPISMWQNFESVFRQARGDYFMWAADDDILSDDWVAELVNALERHREACLAMGDITIFDEYGSYRNGVSFAHETPGWELPVWRRLLRDKHGGYEVQGLFRRACLAGYPFLDHETSPDWPLLCYIDVAGQILRVPGPVIFLPNLPKSGEERAAVQSFTDIGRWPTARLSWTCAMATKAAAAMKGQRRLFFLDAMLVFLSLLWSNRRYLVGWQLEGWHASLNRRRRQTK